MASPLPSLALFLYERYQQIVTSSINIHKYLWGMLCSALHNIILAINLKELFNSKKQKCRLLTHGKLIYVESLRPQIMVYFFPHTLYIHRSSIYKLSLLLWWISLWIYNKTWSEMITSLVRYLFSCSLEIYIHNILPFINSVLLVVEQCILSYRICFKSVIGIPKSNLRANWL